MLRSPPTVAGVGSYGQTGYPFAADGNDVDLVAMAEQPGIDIGPYDKVVIGASIRYGKHQGLLCETFRTFAPVNPMSGSGDRTLQRTGKWCMIFGRIRQFCD